MISMSKHFSFDGSVLTPRPLLDSSTTVLSNFFGNLGTLGGLSDNLRHEIGKQCGNKEYIMK